MSVSKTIHCLFVVFFSSFLSQKFDQEKPATGTHSSFDCVVADWEYHPFGAIAQKRQVVEGSQSAIWLLSGEDWTRAGGCITRGFDLLF